MAKIAPKGKKVVGTKKKDKITWASTKPWKKALTVNGLAGNDVINFKKSGFKNKINGGKGNDKIYGGKKVDTIHGNEGDDLIYGYNGNDKLYGDAGNDKLYGGNGNDYIDGGVGNDILNGDAGNDTMYGGAGNDQLFGGTGNDYIYVGAGNDTVNAGVGTNTIYMKKKDGTNTILNGGGSDTVVFAAEKNFDNFTFTNVGNDLKITAGGTTAVLKNFVTGRSSVKNIKAGNLSINNVYMGDMDSNINGTNGNDLFILNDDESHYVYTGDGNDIIYAKDKSRYYRIFASKGNNYIDSTNAGSTYLFLKGMNGNNTIAPNWTSSNQLKFNMDEESDSSGHYEMLRQLQLANSSTFDYVIGQKSGNDLVMKAINGKTVTVKDFYATYSDRYITVYDYDNSTKIYLYRGKSERIFSDTPELIQLTNEPAVYNSEKNKYIYGNENIAYSLTMNNTSYSNIKLYGAGLQTINLQNAQLNYIETSGGQYNMTIAGDNNYLWLGTTVSVSEFNITGNNNYIDTKNGGGILSSTFNLNGNGNYAYILADAGPININTQGQNKIIMTPDEIGDAPAFNVNSKGNDYFETGDMTRSVTEDYKFNFAGSEGKNKEIKTGVSNDINITGINDVGELKLTMGYSYQIIEHTHGSDYFTIRDYNLNSMSYNNSNSNGSKVTIYGAEGQGAADLNTTAMAAKIKVNSYQFDYEYHSINDLVQFFNIGGNNFAFGDEEEGYMDNLTKDYLIYSSGTSANTYGNFTFESGRHTIYDAGGSDTLNINEGIEDVRVFYNIHYDRTYDSDLYFLKTSEFVNFMKGMDVSGYIQVKNAFDQNSGKIENVVLKEDSFGLEYSSLTSTDARTLVADVATWLQSDGRSYGSVAEVINGGTDTERTALFDIYNSYADEYATNTYWTTHR